MSEDKQFCIREEGAMPIFIDCFSTGEYEIEVEGKLIYFDFGDMFGPLPTTKTGRPRELGPRHKFWRAVSLWKLQGKRTEGKRAIWHEPKKPVLKHLGGRNYWVVEDGEPGWDW